MNKKYTFIILAMIAFTSHMSIAQKSLINPKLNTSLREVKVKSTLDVFNTPLEEEIKGTPYLSDDYRKGVLCLSSEVFPNVPMRYNIFLDLFEFIENDSVYSIDPNPTIKKILLDGQTFIVDLFETHGKNSLGYFARLDSGNATLLIKMKVEFTERGEPKPMQPEVKPAQYKRMPDEIYIKIKNDPPHKIKNIKRLIESLPTNKEKLESFVSSKNISTKNIDDVQALIQYYNSL